MVLSWPSNCQTIFTLIGGTLISCPVCIAGKCNLFLQYIYIYIVFSFPWTRYRLLVSALGLVVPAFTRTEACRPADGFSFMCRKVTG